MSKPETLEPVAYLGPRELLAIVRRCAAQGACRLDEKEAAWARWRAAQAEAEDKLEKWKECLRLSEAAARLARLTGEEQRFKGVVYEGRPRPPPSPTRAQRPWSASTHAPLRAPASCSRSIARSRPATQPETSFQSTLEGLSNDAFKSILARPCMDRAARRHRRNDRLRRAAHRTGGVMSAEAADMDRAKQTFMEKDVAHLENLLRLISGCVEKGQFHAAANWATGLYTSALLANQRLTEMGEGKL